MIKEKVYCDNCKKDITEKEYLVIDNLYTEKRFDDTPLEIKIIKRTHFCNKKCLIDYIEKCKELF